jgi:Na+-translocating ferredoxin:NAD+ oxidoreductase RnfG subunit
MKLLSGVLLLSALLSLSNVSAQFVINTKNRVLMKSLQSAGISDIRMLESDLFPDSLYVTKRINGRYFRVSNAAASACKYVYVGRVNSCRSGGCSISDRRLYDGEQQEFFDYIILFDKNKKIQEVKVFNYQSSHGQEITSKGWLKQFAGHDGSRKLEVNKNIDAISGATVSVDAITADVSMKASLLRKLR